MELTERENRLLVEIVEWAKEFNEHEQTDIQMTYAKWLDRSFERIPEEMRTQFFSKLDSWLFHLHAAIQGTQIQMDARQRIITSAKVFNEEIEYLEELKHLSIDKLTYLADHQIAKHRLYSFAQGGLTGTGGVLLLGVDIPAMTVINLRLVQLIAMTYGYDVNRPNEMMTSLKVFHAATLPKRMKCHGWNALVGEMDNPHLYNFFYEGSEELTDETWLEHPLKQGLKALVILMFRKKLVQGIPLIGMLIGSTMNYQVTRQVSEFAHKYYQYRFLKDKEGAVL